MPAAIPLTGPNGGNWVLIDTLSVSTRTNQTVATGVQSNVVLDAGTTYLAVATGTARIANDSTGFTDAEFIRYNKSTGPQDGSSPGYAWNNHGVRLDGVDGGTTTGNFWGTYQSDHRYVREVTGQGTLLRGWYSDLPGYYGDNSGTLQVDIYAEVPEGTGIIGGIVWQDEVTGNDLPGNDDGLRQDYEPVVNGVMVELLDASGSVVRTTETDSSGAYQFANIELGTYSVQFFHQLLTRFALMDQGSIESRDSDPDAFGRTKPVTLAAANPTNLLISAGMVQVPVPVENPTETMVVFGDGDSKLIGADKGLKVAKWSNAFEADPADPTKPRLYTPGVDQFDFIDRDPDRFNVWVYDLNKWNATNPDGTVKYPYNIVSILTDNVEGYKNYNDGATTIPMTRIPRARGWYWSDSQILVSNKADDATDLPNVGKDDIDVLPGAAGLQKNKDRHENGGFIRADRTHTVALGGTVQAVYVDDANKKWDVKSTVHVQKSIKLHVTILNDKAGGTAPISAEDVNADIVRMREVYAQAGIRVLLVGSSVDDIIGEVGKNQIKNPPVDPDLDFRNGLPIAGSTRELPGPPPRTVVDLSLHEKLLFQDQTLRTPSGKGADSKLSEDIEIYYVSTIKVPGAPDAVTWGNSYFRAVLKDADQAVANTVIIDSKQLLLSLSDKKVPTTLAHEVLHVLVDRGGHVGDSAPTAIDKTNLLVRGKDTMNSGHITDSRRMTPEQVTRMLTANPALLT